MDVAVVLQLVDQLVFKHTGNHLNDLQKNAILGIWQGKTYSEIANDFGYDSENYIGKISRQLYDILSKELGEEVNKSNFCWSVERISNSFNPQFIGIEIKNHVKWCNNNFNNPVELLNNKDTHNKNEPYLDLQQVPKITKFYGRNKELSILSQWLENINTNLISVVGISGIGKTVLVRKVIDIIKNNFDVIIWKNIKLYKSLNEIIREIETLEVFETLDFNNLFELLCNKKCLIILDNLEVIFTPQQIAGQYQTQYQDYQDFFKRVIETEHKSKLILISKEKCQEMNCLDEELYPIKCLNLFGLNDVEIFKNWGLKDEDSYLNLLKLYEGNPFYLQTIAHSIKNIFDGSIRDFLAENELIITKNIEKKLHILFGRLSSKEKEIVSKLCRSQKLLSREELKTNLTMSSTDLINALESLQNRYLLTKITDDQIRFKLCPIFNKYVKNSYSLGD